MSFRPRLAFLCALVLLFGFLVESTPSLPTAPSSQNVSTPLSLLFTSISSSILAAVDGDDCVPEVRLADFGSAFRQYRQISTARDYTAAYRYSLRLYLHFLVLIHSTVFVGHEAFLESFFGDD